MKIRAYFNSFDDPLVASIESVEKASKSFGKEISQETFLQTSVFPAQMGCSSGNREYAIYRAKFEENEKSKSEAREEANKK